jgi:predicted hydrocarbon binding protein
LVIDVQDWVECTGEREETPSCHVTTGLLAAFLGRLAEDVVAVMEVECCTNGERRSRFLVGAPETLQAVFEGMSQGDDYEGVLMTTGRVA